MIGTYVYVIGTSDCPVKVGIARKVEERIRGLQCGCPDRLIEHHRRLVPSILAECIEGDVHARLAPHHRHGEWFDVSAVSATQAVEDAAARYEQGGAPVSSITDDVERLVVAGKVNEWARQAIEHYRHSVRHKIRVNLAAMNAAIRTAGGEPAMASFARVVLERVPLAADCARSPDLLRRREISLVLALNGLAMHFAASKETELLAAIA